MKKVLLFTMMCLMGLFGTINAQTTIAVGSDAGNANIPSATSSDAAYSLSQQIYTSTELASAGIQAGSVIKTVAFMPKTLNVTSANWSVYFINTDKASFDSKTDYVTIADAAVFEGEVALVANEFATITLTTPFEYAGNNLLICVVDNDADATYALNEYAVYATDEMSIYRLGGAALSANNPADGLSGFMANIYGKSVNNRNYVQFTVEGGEEGGEEGGNEGEGEGEATTQVITIGENSTRNQSVPVKADYEYSFSQQIYMQDEIGTGAGTISSIAFSASENFSRTVEVYLVNTEKTSFTNTNGDFVAVSEGVKVYDGNVDFVINDWTTIEFTTPFNYTGKNLVVCVYDKTGTYVNIAPNFAAYSNTTDMVSAGVYSYGALLEEYENGGTLNSERPNKFWDFSANYDAAIDYVTKTQIQLAITAGDNEEDGNEGGEVVADNYRLNSITNAASPYNDHTYVYESETSNKVVKVLVEKKDPAESGYNYVPQYDENGVVTAYQYGLYVDGVLDQTSEYTDATYTYTDGVLTEMLVEPYNPWWSSEDERYAFTYNADGLLTERTLYYIDGESERYGRKVVYTYEDGKLAKKEDYYFDRWDTEDFVLEYVYEYDYDENGNCLSETKYSYNSNEDLLTAQSGVNYYYDNTISAENVYQFQLPQDALEAPAHANIITKVLSYSYDTDWQTGEITGKSNFAVKVYDYTPEVVAAPIAPMDLTAEAVSDTEVVLTWISVEEAESFNIFCGESLVAENVTAKTYTVEGLTPATEYCYTVKGVNGTVLSDASNVACVTTMNLVDITPKAIDFGKARLGEYWSERISTIDVAVNVLGKTVTSIASDNAFFVVPTDIDLTAENIEFAVDYDKTAAAGEYSANLVVTLSTGATIEVPMTATAYTAVTPDLFELATEVEFVDGAYTNTPDFTTLNDDYNLPAEAADANNPDAVYAFTLTDASPIAVEVEGTNSMYAIYNAFAEGEGPKADNNNLGEETILSTLFSYDLESNTIEDFTVINYDDAADVTWEIENGTLISYSYKGWYDEDGNWAYVAKADERLIIPTAYAITPKSVFAFDITRVDASSFDNLTVEITQDGETFHQVAEFEVTPNYYDDMGEDYVFQSNKTVQLGAILPTLGLEYGDYQVVLYHNSNSGGKLVVDNLSLTERANIYPAGDYYLVAAAESEFTVNVEIVTVEEPEVPFIHYNEEAEFNAEALYRLVSTENDINKIVYSYKSEKGTTVVKTESDNMFEIFEYDAAGNVVGYVTTYEYTDEETGDLVVDTLSTVAYEYNDANQLVTSTESASYGPWGNIETVYNYVYNADGNIVELSMEGYKYTYTYNEEGLVSEKIETNVYEDGTEEIQTKYAYSYENGNLVKTEYYSYDYMLETLVLSEEIVYEVDENGNTLVETSYNITYNDDYSEIISKDVYSVLKYQYSKAVASENVFCFDVPHFTLMDPVEPAHANIILLTYSYYSYFDEEAGEVVEHSHTETIYNYEEYEVEDETPVIPAPSNVQAIATGPNTMTLTWDAVEGALAYAVFYYGEYLGATYDTSANLEQLEPETEYCFTVASIITIDEEGYITEISDMSEEACATTGETGVEEVTATFSIYPNPVNDVLFIESSDNVEEVSIYTITGVMVYNETSFSNNAINVSELEGGVYVIKVRTENNEIVNRFVKK